MSRFTHENAERFASFGVGSCAQDVYYSAASTSFSS